MQISNEISDINAMKNIHSIIERMDKKKSFRLVVTT